MKLSRHHLGAVYRLEFSMIELEHLGAQEPPREEGKPISKTLFELAQLVARLEAEVP